MRVRVHVYPQGACSLAPQVSTTCGAFFGNRSRPGNGLREMKMHIRVRLAIFLALALTLAGDASTMAAPAPSRPQGPCDIYAAAGDPCVAAHSTTRALYASYNGPLYQVLRQSDGKTLNIGVVQSV